MAIDDSEDEMLNEVDHAAVKSFNKKKEESEEDMFE